MNRYEFKLLKPFSVVIKNIYSFIGNDSVMVKRNEHINSYRTTEI